LFMLIFSGCGEDNLVENQLIGSVGKKLSEEKTVRKWC